MLWLMVGGYGPSWQESTGWAGLGVAFAVRKQGDEGWCSAYSLYTAQDPSPWGSAPHIPVGPSPLSECPHRQVRSCVSQVIPDPVKPTVKMDYSDSFAFGTHIDLTGEEVN